MKQDQIMENELFSARPLSLIDTDTLEGHRVSVASLVVVTFTMLIASN